MVKTKKRMIKRKPQRKAVAKRSAPSTTLPANPDEALAQIGMSDAKLAPKQRRTLLSLIAASADLHRQLQEARDRIAALEKLVDEDPLMPVCNRRAFVRELTRMMAYAERYGVPGSLVYFDVNNLKHINDTYGHAAGDAVLMQVARVLVESVRATDVVGRLGGDEFGVLLVQTDNTLAERKGKELASLIEQRPISWHGEKVTASVAFGPRSFRGGENADAVLDEADREMYRRKVGRRVDS
jgi:diguanylate cyclase (GGDEF)-like protein